MRTEKGFTLFFSKNDKFSNWYIRDFTVKNITFNCGEQYMMYAKAMLFGDQEMAQKILAAKDPAEQKKLGRQVRGFDHSIWENRSAQILASGLMQKFKQHDDFKQLLLSTEGNILVEASKWDKIWGVGLDEKDPRILDPYQWQGENRLGKVLTTVRETLLRHEKVKERSFEF